MIAMRNLKVGEEFKKALIADLEQSLQCLKEKLLPDRSEQYEAMAAGYINKIKELRGELNA